MDPIGLIAAMPEECRPLLKMAPGWEACWLGRFNGYRLHLGDRECVLIQSGIGMERAGEAVRALAAAASLQLLVSFGVAGAVQDGLQIGDVAAIRSTRLLDRGVAGPAVPLAEFSAPAQAAAAAVLRQGGARLVGGTALTTGGAQAVRLDLVEMENPVLEMETFAIARAAAEFNLPLLALRGVSDNPREPLPIDPGAVLDAANHLRVGPLVRILIRHPEILFKLGRLRRNTALAAENAAAAVRAALGA